jgi:hypothetical protein
MKFEYGLLVAWCLQGKLKFSGEKRVPSSTNITFTEGQPSRFCRYIYCIIFNKSSVEMWQTQNCLLKWSRPRGCSDIHMKVGSLYDILCRHKRGNDLISSRRVRK